MSNRKEKIIESSIDDYKTLPKDKQMFVLGYMQGVLSTQGDKKRRSKTNRWPWPHREGVRKWRLAP